MKKRLSLGNIFLIIPLGLLIMAGAAWSFDRLPQPRWRDLKNSPPNELAAKTNNFFFWPNDIPPEPSNFLLLGAAGAGNDAPDLTDTILMARVDFARQKIYLFSLPRDLLVKIPNGSSFTPTLTEKGGQTANTENNGNNQTNNNSGKKLAWGFAKLNALYALNKNNSGREFDLIKQKVRDITGLAIDHYVFVNLAAVKETIDILGGVNVMVARDIYDPIYPGSNHSYETFELKAGWRYLDGETALKYIRSRHSTSDFDRVIRQQEILQALKQKATTLNFWNIGTFYDIYSAISANVKTDLNLLQLNDYWTKFQNAPGENIIKNELTDLLATGEATLGGATASIVRPKAGVENYTAIKDYVNKIISQN